MELRDIMLQYLGGDKQPCEEFINLFFLNEVMKKETNMKTGKQEFTCMKGITQEKRIAIVISREP